ncbi:hypothetical protein L1887_61994 [Cichorium endivia]|nr:hypothetical protein L1887_61994 [Cichorium endivia]
MKRIAAMMRGSLETHQQRAPASLRPQTNTLAAPARDLAANFGLSEVKLNPGSGESTAARKLHERVEVQQKESSHDSATHPTSSRCPLRRHQPSLMPTSLPINGIRS